MIGLAHFTTQVLNFLEELLYVLTALHFDSVLDILLFDVINLFECIITILDIVSILQLMRLKLLITINEMQFLHFTKFIHDVPAEVFADCELVQIYVFGSKA